MTEERMIRVTKEQLENISEYFDSDVSIFDQIFEMFSCFDGEVTEYDYRLKRFDGLEPAPPKGWTPRCFIPCVSGEGWCAEPETDATVPDCCLNCPRYFVKFENER